MRSLYQNVNMRKRLDLETITRRVQLHYMFQLYCLFKCEYLQSCPVVLSITSLSNNKIFDVNSLKA